MRLIKILRMIKRMFILFCCPKKQSYEIQIETTNCCNAHCEFCINPKLKREKGFMSDEIFEKIISRIKGENIKIRRFILHINGEPLIDNNIFSRISRLKSEFPTSAIRFTTNFSLADEDKRKRILNSGVDEITISLNSIDSNEYEKIMKLPYNATIANVRSFIKEVNDSNSHIKVNFSIVAYGGG